MTIKTEEEIAQFKLYLDNKYGLQEGESAFRLDVVAQEEYQVEFQKFCRQSKRGDVIRVYILTAKDEADIDYDKDPVMCYVIKPKDVEI